MMANGTVKVKVEFNEEFIERIKELYEDGMMAAYESGYKAGLKDAAQDILGRLEKFVEEMK